MGDMICFSFVTILYFFRSWKRGDVCAPHFFFSCKRKRNVPRPVQRKRELGAAFVAKGTLFSFVFYVLTVSDLVLRGLVFPLAPLPLTGWENCFFTIKKRLSFRKPLDVLL